MTGVIFNTIKQLKPPGKWTETEATEFKKHYYNRTGKVIDSLNPSYPFSSFFDGSNYTINGRSVDMNTLNNYSKGEDEYEALMKQWENMTSKMVYNMGNKEREPLYSEFAEKVAEKLGQIKVTNQSAAPSPKRQRTNYFLPAVLLLHSNKDANAFESFLRNQMPNKGGKPTQLIKILNSLERPVALSYIDQQVVDTASATLGALAQKYYQKSCELKEEVTNDLRQYDSYLKGARVSPTLTSSQYSNNVKNIDTGPLLGSKLAILRRSLFKEWQSFARASTKRYKDSLDQFQQYKDSLKYFQPPPSPTSQYKPPQSVVAALKDIPAAQATSCFYKSHRINRRQQAKQQAEAQAKALQQAQAQAVKKFQNAKNKTMRKGRQQIKNQRDALMRKAGISKLKGNDKICQQWYDIVVDMYRTKFTTFTGDMVQGTFNLIAPQTKIPYTLNNQTKSLTLNDGTNVAKDEFIDRLLTKEQLECDEQSTLYLKNVRINKKKEIKAILNKMKMDLIDKIKERDREAKKAEEKETAKQARKEAQRKQWMQTEKEAASAKENRNFAKEVAKQARKEKATIVTQNAVKAPPAPPVKKPDVPAAPPAPPAETITVPKAPKENPWNKKMDKDNVSKVNPMTNPPLTEKPKAKENKAPMPVKKATVKVGGGRKKPSKKPKEATVAVTKEVAPTTLEVIKYGKYTKGRFGAYLLTKDFAVNGSFYLENVTKASEKTVSVDTSLIYKYDGANQGEYITRYTNKPSDGKNGEDINNIWDKSKRFSYKEGKISLTYNGTTYVIPDTNNVMWKSVSEKRPLTFIWLEPNTKAESFQDENNKRKRLQNRVQITYDSMSEDDILEIEKAMQEYDDTLEKAVSDYDSDTSFEKASYDSSSNVSNAKSYDSSSDVSYDKASYDSSSDVSMEKDGYDSHSDNEKVQRSMYDSGSDVCETEMDYSYDSSSGVDEDGNMPYISDSDN